MPESREQTQNVYKHLVREADRRGLATVALNEKWDDDTLAREVRAMRISLARHRDPKPDRIGAHRRANAHQ